MQKVMLRTDRSVDSKADYLETMKYKALFILTQSSQMPLCDDCAVCH